MNTFRHISNIFVVIGMMFVLGCASTTEKASTGEYFDDSVITLKVKDALLKEPDLKSTEISVETFKGVVQLSGFVTTQTNVNKAVALAREVNGVKSVQNKMQVK